MRPKDISPSADNDKAGAVIASEVEGQPFNIQRSMTSKNRNAVSPFSAYWEYWDAALIR